MNSKPLQGKCIWIVEDEFLLGLELQMMVEDAGGTVIGPDGNLEAALEKWAVMERKPDAAVLDVDINGRDVFPVAEKVEAAGVPFLFNTGHGDRDELKDRFGGVTVCIKPTSEDEIMRELARMVGVEQAD